MKVWQDWLLYVISHNRKTSKREHFSSLNLHFLLLCLLSVKGITMSRQLYFAHFSSHSVHRYQCFPTFLKRRTQRVTNNIRRVKKLLYGPQNSNFSIKDAIWITFKRLKDVGLGTFVTFPRTKNGPRTGLWETLIYINKSNYRP